MMSLPHFLCIGAQKAGTTWLYEMLAQNPGIWLPPLKEVHYFDIRTRQAAAKERRREQILKVVQRIERSGHSKGSGGTGQIEFLRGLMGPDLLTEEWYRRIFSHPDSKGRVSGEITPAYLALDEDEILYAKSLLPDAKLILVVREAYARGLSQVKMAAARLKTDNVSDEEWEGLLDNLRRIDRGNYRTGIPLWQKHFGTEQLLILPFSLVKTDPAGMIRSIEDFIGVRPHNGYKAIDQQVHKTKEVSVPEWVTDEVAKFTAPQKQYLIDTFGMDFYEKTR